MEDSHFSGRADSAGGVAEGEGDEGDRAAVELLLGGMTGGGAGGSGAYSYRGQDGAAPLGESERPQAVGSSGQNGKSARPQPWYVPNSGAAGGAAILVQGAASARMPVAWLLTQLEQLQGLQEAGGKLRAAEAGGQGGSGHGVRGSGRGEGGGEGGCTGGVGLREAGCLTAVPQICGVSGVLCSLQPLPQAAPGARSFTDLVCLSSSLQSIEQHLQAAAAEPAAVSPHAVASGGGHGAQQARQGAQQAQHGRVAQRHLCRTLCGVRVVYDADAASLATPAMLRLTGLALCTGGISPQEQQQLGVRAGAMQQHNIGSQLQDFVASARLLRVLLPAPKTVSSHGPHAADPVNSHGEGAIALVEGWQVRAVQHASRHHCMCRHGHICM